jgi:4-amino-4-deoxy-L-arabinose transferase-like glycosyltransferase
VRRPFDIDDPLFVRAAQNIVAHPSDPYGFSLVWYWNQMPMWQVTKNPPLACYYAALLGRALGWSEQALHIGFILPAIAVVLGTYRLAARFTKHAMLAAAATLLAPGFLVSACSVMSDVTLTAFWTWALVLWVEGIERQKGTHLLAAAFLVSAAELTKYLGVLLMVLFLVYALAAKQKLRTWAPYWLMPLVVLAGYEYWGHLHYGQGLFLSAVEFSREQRRARHLTKVAGSLVGLSFAGGSLVSSLTFAPLIWSRRQMALAAAAVTSLVAIVAAGLTKVAAAHAHEHWMGLCIELALFVAAGVSLLALPAAEWRRRDRDCWFLALWVFGVFYFASYVNYVINVRTMIPLLPAAAILLARRIEHSRREFRGLIAHVVPLLLTGGVAFWVSWGDTAFGQAQQAAAFSLEPKSEAGTVWFEGRWGFAYYMEREGARAFDGVHSELRAGDLLVAPSLQDIVMPGHRYALERTLHFDVPARVATQDWDLGAGFYSSRHGPLPFAFGPVSYKFYVFRLEF